MRYSSWLSSVAAARATYPLHNGGDPSVVRPVVPFSRGIKVDRVVPACHCDGDLGQRTRLNRDIVRKPGVDSVRVRVRGVTGGVEGHAQARYDTTVHTQRCLG